MSTMDAETHSVKKLKSKSAQEIDNQKLVSYTLDSLEGGVITISREGTVTSFNSAAERILGYCAEEAVGEHYRRLIPSEGEARRIVEMVHAALTEGATFSSEEAVIPTSSGKRIPVGMTISQLHDEQGSSLGVVLTFKDLAEIKRVRDQILRTEQMAALGYLAAGLAHELRNPLGSLQGLAELLQDDLGPEDPRRVYADTFIGQVERMNKLVEDLLCFARPSIATLERVSLNDLIRESVLFASHDFRDRKINVETKYHPDLPEVMVDPERFSQSLLNVIRNAFQATPDGGTITVATGIRKRGNEIRPYASISNTGSYVEPEVRQKLFTPFFTLKKGGTGLGLSIAHQIVKGHSGYIEVDSDPDEGTTFVIDLPTADSLPAGCEEAINAGSHAG